MLEIDQQILIENTAKKYPCALISRMDLRIDLDCLEDNKPCKDSPIAPDFNLYPDRICQDCSRHITL